MKLTIPIPEKISLNKIYAGIHFRQRSQHKDDYHFAVMSASPKPYTGDFPVHVHYHFKLHGNQLDISNHAYMQKMVEDGLVACGVIPDDNQKYVASFTPTSEKIPDEQDQEVILNIRPFDEVRGLFGQ